MIEDARNNLRVERIKQYTISTNEIVFFKSQNQYNSIDNCQFICRSFFIRQFFNVLRS